MTDGLSAEGIISLKQSDAPRPLFLQKEIDMRLLPHLSLCFALGVLCNIVAYDAGNKFGWFGCTAAGTLCFYCFFSRIHHYICEGE